MVFFFNQTSNKLKERMIKEERVEDVTKITVHIVENKKRVQKKATRPVNWTQTLKINAIAIIKFNWWIC